MRKDTVSALASQRSLAINAPLVLPPGFLGCLICGDPWRDALEAADTEQAGTVFWSDAGGLCRAAIVLAPDRPLGEGVVVNLGLLAVLDALAVLAPPHVPLDVVFPATILVDGAVTGAIRSAHGPGSADIPGWAVLGIEVAVCPQHASPGDTPDQTSLGEEGFGDVTPADVLQHACRHLLGWIDVWQEEGDAALARAVLQHLPRRAAA